MLYLYAVVVEVAVTLYVRHGHLEIAVHSRQLLHRKVFGIYKSMLTLRKKMCQQSL